MFGVFAFIFEPSGQILLGLSFLLIYISYYLLEAVKKPELICGPGELRSMLENEVSLVHERYWPTPWCLQPHLHTAAASLLRSRLLPRQRYRRELLRLPDGGLLALDWARDPALDAAPAAPAAGTLLVLPGIVGDSGADYARCLAAAARRLRLRCCVVNHRGMGGAPLATPRLYCALSEDDAGAAAAHAAALHGGPVFAAGVSLGGLLAARLAGGGALAGALAVSAPLDVERGAAALAAGAANALLSRHLARRLRRAAEPLRALAPHAADWRAVEAARSVREFDAALTARHFGFPSVDAYYAAATMRGRLAAVRAPLLCLCAADDPFQPRWALPLAEAAQCARAALLVTSRGGHIGWAEGWRPAARAAHDHYFARLAEQYFGALLRRSSAPAAPPPA